MIIILAAGESVSILDEQGEVLGKATLDQDGEFTFGDIDINT